MKEAPDKRVFDATSDRYIPMPAFERMPCGAMAPVDDTGSFPAYRCQNCGALKGSMGVPDRCQESAGET
ncbi:hypothetical protein [Thioalkalivibrio sp. ALE19]|uniref:hypothetical protein n=1 Tax=Thioalkalivibrio sp. ALE19 TaxID=1266909 RepID=UPI0004077620|nr:hypothetical protein [Thioalkalivibrio sp. ALE19]